MELWRVRARGEKHPSKLSVELFIPPFSQLKVIARKKG
jgi:hypothetical protein